MRRAGSVSLFFARGVRQRVTSKPVDWVQEATTYSDTFSTVLDPYTSPAYPEKVPVKLLEFILDATCLYSVLV